MNFNIGKKGAIIIVFLLLGTAFFVPAGSQTEKTNIFIDKKLSPSETNDEIQGYKLDRSYIFEPALPPSFADDNDDAGYKTDAGNEMARAKAIYPGEIVDDSPGRGVNGKLSSTDFEDWYYFSVCNGQQITVNVTVPTGYDFDLDIINKNGTVVASSSNPGNTPEFAYYTADYPGRWYMRIKYVNGSGTGRYTFGVVLVGQNDAETGMDAGNDFASATMLTPGRYYGYLDKDDGYDWYKFNVNSGQWIHFTLKTSLTFLSDFDIELYNPSGEFVYRESYYTDDELWYPADASGLWRAKIYLFPGWIDIPNPTEWTYYAYGSGVYDLTFSLESSGPSSPPAPVSQPQITPMAKTFKVANDPTSSKDEYGYFASIPACNYVDGGVRYLAPIIYTGDSTPTGYYDDPNAYGTVDDTVQYLVDDWNSYLSLMGKTPVEYNVLTDPVQAAADIATKYWTTSDTAVVAIDGSGYQDTTRTVLKRTATLKRTTEVIEFKGDDPKYNKDFGYQLFIGPKWGAINVSVYNVAAATSADLLNLFPKFIGFADDWWPDFAGEPRTDIYYPITRMGIWTGKTSSASANHEFKITKYACDRYRIFLGDADKTLKVTIKTTELSDLLVFLVDPSGNLRAPIIEAWNGGPVMPIHWWNGFENETGFDEWRSWNPAPHTEFTAEVLHPEKGMWTAIVVPRNAEGSPKIKYTITGTVTKLNPKGTNAAISAANAAVIASQKHLPLLYVKEDSVPTETANAFTTLGVNKVIFVERNNIGNAVRNKLPTIEDDLTTMQDIIDYIKDDPSSENYITITSLKTGVGQATAAAMLAAYHGAPVLRIEEAPGNPAGIANCIEAYFRWDGDYYHGERSCGHLPRADNESGLRSPELFLNLTKYFISGGKKGSLPPFGMDMDRYWFEALYKGIHDMINGYGLDREGQEGICFVASRNDIFIPAYAACMGNNSYTGGIPGITPAYSSALVVRNILYPALIFANPNRNITTTQLMNFPDGTSWKTNDMKITAVFSSRAIKKCFSSHGRIYEGHCLWDAHLERMNNGASILYYSGHGTGGSGISAQYVQTEHSKYPDQQWWDGWRGYMYDNWKTPRDGGWTWYNPSPPNLYDIVHYKWVDQLFENLRSCAVFYMSCTTGDGNGPLVYLDHGAVCWYGNAGSGLCPEADLQDDEFFKDALINGEPIGQAYSKQVWLHYRDYTTGDPISMYGPSSLYGGAESGGVTTRQVIYGDPNLIIYSPEWTVPIPVD
ncbi:MAG: PPC domain-containing protein [Thermoplasmatota archaeon]